MKIGFFAFVLTLSVLSSTGFADLLVPTGGTLAGSGISYTFSNAQANGPDGIEPTTNAGITVTLQFTGGPVDLLITDTSNSSRVIFDDAVGTRGDVDSNIFAADAGSWGFTAGTANIPSFTGVGTNTFTFGSLASGWPDPDEDWGQLTISGITSLNWTIDDESNYEVFRFEAVASTPEPSALFLVGLTAPLVLHGRRRRKES